MLNRLICSSALTLVCTAVLNVSVASGQDDQQDTAWLIKVLDVKPGSVVADIGAGPEALLTIPLARHVGPSGRIYATELGASVEKLRAAVNNAGVGNVHVRAGDPSATNLPPECCDSIFIRYVYHHFADPPAMNASVRQALKPGGVLAIIEFAPRKREASTPAARAADETHGVGAEAIVRELKAAGFEVVSSEQQSDRMVRVVARKPSR